MLTNSGQNADNLSKGRTVVYWIATIPVATVLAVGGVADILLLPQFNAVMRHLGYPDYFTVILGVWKLLGAAALLAPRFPRLKEWAYAGTVFNMTGAFASHLATGDGLTTLIAPFVFTILTFVSWYLRPASRRDIPARGSRTAAND